MNDASPAVSRVQILVVDGQQNIRATTAMLLQIEGYTVFQAATSDEALRMLSAHAIELMITEVKMEPMEGLTLLKKALEASPQLQVIVMTAFGSIVSAVQAMRQGAFDYITKPFKFDELTYRVERAQEHARLLKRFHVLSGDFDERHGRSALVGRSPAMRELMTRMMRAAQSDAPVLIQGERGTGKEFVARSLHAQSRRKGHPFVVVHCTAGSEEQLEVELFGRNRRGFFEEADGGTLFLDEVTDMPPTLQARLSRTLQDGEVRRVGASNRREVDVRVIAATHLDIEQEVGEKHFRQALFYQLNRVPLRVPPLRERMEDVPALAEHFLQQANERGMSPRRLSSAAMEHLLRYSFPGNVGELENLIQRAVASAEDEELQPEDFPLSHRAPPRPSSP